MRGRILINGHSHKHFSENKWSRLTAYIMQVSVNNKMEGILPLLNFDYMHIYIHATMCFV